MEDAKHIPYKVSLGALYAALLVFLLVQFSTLVWGTHRKLSYKNGFLFLCIVWTALRLVFWVQASLYSSEETSNSVLFGTEVLVLWISAPVQYATFTFLLLYYCKVLAANTWKGARRRWYTASFVAFNLATTGLTLLFIALVFSPGISTDETQGLQKAYLGYNGVVFLLLASAFITVARQFCYLDRSSTVVQQHRPRTVIAVNVVISAILTSRGCMNVLQMTAMYELSIPLDRSRDIQFTISSAYFIWEIFPTILLLFTVGLSCTNPFRLCAARARAKLLGGAAQRSATPAGIAANANAAAGGGGLFGSTLGCVSCPSLSSSSRPCELTSPLDAVDDAHGSAARAARATPVPSFSAHHRSPTFVCAHSFLPRPAPVSFPPSLFPSFPLSLFPSLARSLSRRSSNPSSRRMSLEGAALAGTSSTGAGGSGLAIPAPGTLSTHSTVTYILCESFSQWPLKHVSWTRTMMIAPLAPSGGSYFSNRNRYDSFDPNVGGIGPGAHGPAAARRSQLHQEQQQQPPQHQHQLQRDRLQPARSHDATGLPAGRGEGLRTQQPRGRLLSDGDGNPLPNRLGARVP